MHHYYVEGKANMFKREHMKGYISSKASQPDALHPPF